MGILFRSDAHNALSGELLSVFITADLDVRWLDGLKEGQTWLLMETFPTTSKKRPPRIKAIPDGMCVALTNASDRTQVQAEKNDGIATNDHPDLGP
jgi:hypothetical protein